MSPFAWEWWRFAWSCNAGTLEMRGWRQLWGRLYWREHGPYDRTFMDKLFGDWWFERACEKVWETVFVPIGHVLEILLTPVAWLLKTVWALIGLVIALVIGFSPIWAPVLFAIIVAKWLGVL